MKNPLANVVLLNTSKKFLQTALFSTKGHVLIGGGTGFIGKNLKEFLLRENYQVTVISRVRTGEKHIMNWADLITNGVPNDVTAVVNLSGEPIMIPFKSFGNNFKKKIWISRVGCTALLTDIINSSKCKPKVFITITNTDIYPSDGEIYTEKFIPTDQMVDSNFFTRLGTDWEQASKYFPFRKVSIRTGTVLGDNGGFLRCLKYPTAIGLGAQIGDGCQQQPWIHICDLLNLILFSIENEEISGILNGVSPQGVTNGEITTIYTLMLKKSPVMLNIPTMLLKIAFGEERTKLMLEGRKVLPRRTLNCGFKFQHCEIRDALKNVLGQ